jgi:hypothetical protein
MDYSDLHTHSMSEFFRASLIVSSGKEETRVPKPGLLSLSPPMVRENHDASMENLEMHLDVLET